MDLIPSLRQATSLLLVTVCISLPQATSWNGMLQAQPAFTTLSREVQVLNLSGFREASILVGTIPDAFKDSVTAEHIEDWVANRMKTMGMSVVSKEDQMKTFYATARDADEKALATNDRFRSRVIVEVEAMRLSAGDAWANVSVACSRGVFVHPGYYTDAVVWTSGGLCRFGPGYEEDGLKAFLNRLLDWLETNWKKCNP